MKPLRKESTPHPQVHKPRREHSVPWFWPLAAGIELEDEGMKEFQDNLKFLEQAAEVTLPPPPVWATDNRVRLDMDTMRLREFSARKKTARGMPVLVDAPYAGGAQSHED